jgi:Kef-type K+ transport system membrane component KefB
MVIAEMVFFHSHLKFPLASFVEVPQNVIVTRLKVAGILLGPSVLGLIPGFSETVFPPESLELLEVLANFGLILFMFLVGLEGILLCTSYPSNHVIFHFHFILS